MLDQGLLRSAKDYQFDAEYMPKLINQVNADIERKVEATEEIDDMVKTLTNKASVNHRLAILTEIKRRDDAAKE